jgi:hypothetical protein
MIKLSVKILLLILLAGWVTTLLASGPSEKELDAYCMGYCKARYNQGYYCQGNCCCVDRLPINDKERFYMPHRKKESFNPPETYDGVDRPHIPMADPTDF